MREAHLTGATECAGLFDFVAAQNQRRKEWWDMRKADIAVEAADERSRQMRTMSELLEIVQQLSLERGLEGIVDVVRRSARSLAGSDGATFVLREDSLCHYVDEDAIGPLWKGKRFPMTSCISGWAMLNKQVAIVPDIYADARIPVDAYRPTFVKSLVMVPIRSSAPIGAIGAYWARPHVASEFERRILQGLADAVSVAIENVTLVLALETRIEDAKRAVRVRDEFLANASHVLRNPVNALELQVEVLRRTGRDDSYVRKLSETLRALACDLDRLLEVSWVSRGSLQLAPERVDLLELAQEVCRSRAAAARAAGCEVAVTGTRALGVWDRARVADAISSVVSNAIKFGAGHPVQVTVEPRGPSAVLSVRDEGPGIPEEDLSRIFDRFTRPAAPPHGGLGLGLYLTREIVAAHRGSIRVESRPGCGATFVFELPLTAA